MGQVPAEVPGVLVSLVELVGPVGPVDHLGVALVGLLVVQMHPLVAALAGRPAAHPLQLQEEAAAGHSFVVDRPKAGPAAPSWAFLWPAAAVVLPPVLLQTAVVVVHQMASHLGAVVVEPHPAFAVAQMLVLVVAPPRASEEVRGVLRLVSAAELPLARLLDHVAAVGGAALAQILPLCRRILYGQSAARHLSYVALAFCGSARLAVSSAP